MNLTKKIGCPAKIKLSSHEQRILDSAAELCDVIAANASVGTVLHDEAKSAGQKLAMVAMHLNGGEPKADE